MEGSRLARKIKIFRELWKLCWKSCRKVNVANLPGLIMANLLILAVLLESLCALSLCCSYGDLRLVNGPSSLAGRMEVCKNSVWGTVCHDGITPGGVNGNAAAKVACRQLGFSDQGDCFFFVNLYPPYREANNK